MRIIYYDGTTDSYVDKIEFSTDGKNIILDGTKVVPLINVLRIIIDRCDGHLI